jgi:hypothetical protein
LSNITNQLKPKAAEIEDIDDLEFLETTPPKMEQKPRFSKPNLINKNSEPGLKIDPLSMLRSSFNQRKDLLFKPSTSDPPSAINSARDTHSSIASPPERDNIMTRASNKISELKLTSLSERKSLKRELRQPLQIERVIKAEKRGKEGKIGLRVLREIMAKVLDEVESDEDMQMCK